MKEIKPFTFEEGKILKKSHMKNFMGGRIEDGRQCVQCAPNCGSIDLVLVVPDGEDCYAFSESNCNETYGYLCAPCSYFGL